MSEKNHADERSMAPLEALDLDFRAFGDDAPADRRAPEPIAERPSSPARKEPDAASPRSTSAAPTRTHFAESVGRSRPSLDSEPPEPLDAESIEEPIDLPRNEPAGSPLRNLLRTTAGRAARRLGDAGAEFRAAAARWRERRTTTPRARPGASAERKPAKGRRPLRGPAWFGRFREPVLGLGTIALVYAVTTTALGTAPWSGRSGVPDLGGPALSAAPSRLPEQRNFRVSAEGKPDSAASQASSAVTIPEGEIAPGPAVEETALPSDLSFPGKSLLEVVTPEDELIYVDGVFIGRGPLRRMPVPPGAHVVSIRSGGTERKGALEARAGRLVRASFIDGTTLAVAAP